MYLGTERITHVIPNWFQHCQCGCCLCYRREYFGVGTLIITEPRYLKLVTISSFCPFTLISVLMALVRQGGRYNIVYTVDITSRGSNDQHPPRQGGIHIDLHTLRPCLLTLSLCLSPYTLSLPVSLHSLFACLFTLSLCLSPYTLSLPVSLHSLYACRLTLSLCWSPYTLSLPVALHSLFTCLLTFSLLVALNSLCLSPYTLSVPVALNSLCLSSYTLSVPDSLHSLYACRLTLSLYLYPYTLSLPVSLHPLFAVSQPKVTQAVSLVSESKDDAVCDRRAVVRDLVLYSQPP